MVVKLNFGTEFIEFCVHCKKNPKTQKNPQTPKKTLLKHKTKEGSSKKKHKTKADRLMEALQKLRKQQAAVRMRATMITASEHCAKSLGANIPPRVTTKPCPSSLLKFAKWSWVSGTLLCESLIKSLF